MIPRLWEAIWRDPDPASIPVADRSNTPCKPLLLNGRNQLNCCPLAPRLSHLAALDIGDPQPCRGGGRSGAAAGTQPSVVWGPVSRNRILLSYSWVTAISPAAQFTELLPRSE